LHRNILLHLVRYVHRRGPFRERSAAPPCSLPQRKPESRTLTPCLEMLRFSEEREGEQSGRQDLPMARCGGGRKKALPVTPLQCLLGAPLSVFREGKMDAPAGCKRRKCRKSRGRKCVCCPTQHAAPAPEPRHKTAFSHSTPSHQTSSRS